jgi:aminopeptidase YwaD
MRLVSRLANVATAALACVAWSTSEQAPASTSLRATLSEAMKVELRGKQALDHIYRISTFHRSVGSRGYHAAADYVAGAARAAGLKEVEVLTFPVNGSRRILDTYEVGYAWQVEGGELTIDGTDVRLCRYDDVPTCVVEYSAAIDTTAELVDVGAGTASTDYADKDVRGKWILTSSPASAALAFARQRYGVIGVVSYWGNYAPDRGPFPDQVAWQAVPADSSGQLSAFSISARAAAALKRQLADGRVKLHGRIDARVFEGQAEVVTGIIPGKGLPEEEVLFTSHLNHHKPGANDNASGCGLDLEIAAVLTRLIADGRIPPPKRTIRFIWMPEHRGTQLYLDRFRDYARRGIADINNDMVGEDQQECNSVFVLVRTPDSLPTYLNDFLESLAEDVAREQFRSPFGTRNQFHYRSEPYSGAISDHAYFVDGSIRMPALLLNFTPDNFYHSNEDTADHCDPTSLMRVGYIAGVAGAYLASAGAAEGRQLATLTTSAALGRLGRTLADGIAALQREGDIHLAYREARNRLVQAGLREAAAVRSVIRLARELSDDDAVRRMSDHVERVTADHLKALSDAYAAACAAAGTSPTAPQVSTNEETAARLVPVRHLYGPLRFSYLTTRLPEERRAWYERNELPPLAREEVLNFMDGRRDILTIRNAVSAEHGPVSLQAVRRFVDDLISVGLVTVSHQ